MNRKLPLRKQLTFALIVGGVAFATSFLLGLLVAVAGSPGQPGPSPLIGLSFGAVAGVVYLALANNRRLPLADDAARARALAPVTDGSGRLIVYREGFMGKYAGVDVHVDDAVRTQLKSPRSAALTLTPGPHALYTEVQGKKSDTIDIGVGPNETVVVQIVIGLGKTKLVRQDAATVHNILAHIPMVQS